MSIKIAIFPASSGRAEGESDEGGTPAVRPMMFAQNSIGFILLFCKVYDEGGRHHLEIPDFTTISFLKSTAHGGSICSVKNNIME